MGKSDDLLPVRRCWEDGRKGPGSCERTRLPMPGRGGRPGRQDDWLSMVQLVEGGRAESEEFVVLEHPLQQERRRDGWSVDGREEGDRS